MNKDNLFKIIENQFDELDNIFHNIVFDDMDEDQCLLYDACKNIGIENILTIKELLIEIVNTDETFQFNQETLNNMIGDEYHDIILNFIWRFAMDDNIETTISLSKEQYYEKLKNGLNYVQQESINNILNNNFNNGIVCMATGSGKSLVMLKCIDLFNSKKEKNRSILIFTERKNILLDLFYISERDNDKIIYKPNIPYWNVWKRLDIINMDDFNLINLVSNKNKSWTELKSNEKNKFNYY